MGPVEAPFEKLRQIRLTVVGDPLVGKTTLINQFLLAHSDLKSSTSEASVITPLNKSGNRTKVLFEGKEYELTILDTNDDQTRRHASYIGTDIVLILYAVDDWNSHGNVNKKWVPEIRERLPFKPFILVANKADLKDGTDQSEQTCFVSIFDGMQKCSDVHGAAFFECSAANGENVASILKEVPPVYEREFLRLLQNPETTPCSAYDMAMTPVTVVKKATPVLKQCVWNIKENVLNPASFPDAKSTIYGYFSIFPNLFCMPSKGDQNSSDDRKRRRSSEPEEMKRSKCPKNKSIPIPRTEKEN